MQNLQYHIHNSELSLGQLSEKSGITPDRIKAISEKSVEPTMSDVRKLSKALKFSIDFLLADNDKFEELNVLFRKASLDIRDTKNADMVSYIVGNSFSLLKDYETNPLIFDGFPAVNNTYIEAGLLASKFRNLFFKSDFVSPLIELPKLVSDELNCLLYVIDLGKGCDGASAVINKIPFIFISPRFAPRMLFTLAHELGHILAHHNKEVNFAKFDKIVSTYIRNDKSKDEGFANAFASQLLLPESGVGITLKKIRSLMKITGDLGDVEIILLSRIYGVSFEVAAKRCEDLGLLPSGGAISLYEHIKENYESPEKRAVELQLPERPEIVFPKVSPSLIKAAIRKINTGELSLGKASEILSVSINEIITQNIEK